MAIVDGRVTEEDFQEPLAKATIQLRGTGIYTVTNRFGYYRMKLPPADFMVEAIHPGIYSEFYNMSTYEGIFTPMGAVRLEPTAVGRKEQRDIAARIAIAKHPAATQNSSAFDLLKQAGSVEFNHLLSNQPSVYLLENGSGYGSSEIRVRGFSANQNQIVFNGVSLNNPETGSMNSPLYPGLNDWASDVQFTTGVASGKQSELGQTGLINVLPLMPQKKFGVNVLGATGLNGYLKTAATIHSGYNKRNLAFALKLDRSSGDGLADYTGFTSYGMLFNLYKAFNHRHSILLTNATKSWQSDQRSRPDSISKFAQYGIEHNSNWGFLNNKEQGWNGNFGFTNLAILTHNWHKQVHSRLVSQLYLEFTNSVQTHPSGTMNGLSPYQLPPSTAGLVDFDTISQYNDGRTNSETEGITILAAATRSLRWGMQSQYLHEFNKQTKGFIQIDFESYRGRHFGTVNNLLGAAGFTSQADLNGTTGNVEKLLASAFLPKTGKADKADHSYEALIRKVGASLNLEHTGNKTFSYLEAAFFVKSQQRTDHFNYLSSDPLAKTDAVNKMGWRLASGITYRINEFNSFRLNAGASASPARFNILFPSANNRENPEAENRNLYSGDLAYVLSSGRFYIALRGYAMYQQNQSNIQRLMLNTEESFALINGLEQFHRGLEFNSQITYLRRHNFYLAISYAKWTYQKSATASVYDNANQLLSRLQMPMKGYNTDNCPPVSMYVKNEFNILKGLEVNINYYRAFKSYAPLLVHDFDETDSPEQIKLPSFDRLGAGINYYHEFRNKRSISVFGEVHNFLNNEYINAIYTNISSPEAYAQNLAHYGSPMSWNVGLSFNF
ncbi:TonB-dependent receptor plug domain-containing protein [Mangrovibacterium marinum]|uniref:TonB-dependent receptor-like protein n=1 Tax=Mangrovibacterium marinum TaxID=1639118 RepID=A0A2T5C2S2_9BACT|nr:TonB-dependent receptor plug domain-containing protein [Mangrovibacterium marinum]PTN09016.1 TonB-dependent receptor-like protein [Mangrovibacterium marinum]